MAFRITDWIDQRSADACKVEIADKIKPILDLIGNDQRVAFHSDLTSNAEIICEEGLPVVNLAKIFPRDYFKYRHKPMELWRTVETTKDEAEFYLSGGLLKYKDCETPINNHFDVSVFMPSYGNHIVNSKIRSIASWAVKNRVTVLFKRHPAKNIGIDHAFAGIASKYVTIAGDVSVKSVIDSSDFIIGVNSSVLLAAMIYGKPCASLANFEYSEIIPVISSPDEICGMKPICMDDVLKFLYWHKNVYSIDVNQDDAIHRLSSRVDRFLEGASVSDVLKEDLVLLSRKTKE